MDVLVLIDKLDELVHNAKAVPLTDQVRIDREEIWEILDQMRATIPDEIKQARWIVKERQEMLAEAKREADSNDQLTLIDEVGPWRIYQVADSDIVTPLTVQPVVVNERPGDQRERALELGSSWFQNSSEWAALPAFDGPDSWEHIDAKIGRAHV